MESAMSSPLIFRCARCGAMNRIALLVPEREPVCGKCKEDLDTAGVAAHVDVAALERAIASSPAPVLVDFWAPWCAPCRSFAPVLEKFAHEQAGRFVVLKLDTEASPAAGARFGIQAIPTLVVFRGGREVERVAGALPLEELRRFAAAAAVTAR
jgi:thioredoxin 2